MGATRMLSKAIDVDGLKVFCSEGGAPGRGHLDIEIDCVAAL
jgi:hypothetical protein